MRKILVRCLPCLIFLIAANQAFSQTARFSGVVTDPQNAAVPGAQIQVVNKESTVALETKTDGAGSYSVPYLTAGHYRVLVQAPGFNQIVNDDILLGVGQALVLNIQLTVGSTQSTVNVQGGGGAAEVQTENAEISGTITGKEVTSIGLNGRNFTQFIDLVPGVSNQTQQDEARVGLAGSVSYSVNGGRTEYNSFQVDGSETLNVGINKNHSSLIVTPSIDAIQEIKVLTSNYGAMYPSTGNGTTLVTTKSGSDHFHGNLYEFFRNEIFNSKGYFDVTNGAPLYRRSDFGGTIGGPVLIPHFYDGRGKTHFFFSEEVRIEKDPYAYRQAVPSLAERNGDFSDVCPGSDCPTRATVGPYYLQGVGLSGSGALNRNALAILGTGIIPAANATTGCTSTVGSCYNGEVSLPTTWREELFRIDHTINSKMQASFRYIHDDWSETTPVPEYGFIQNNFPTIQNRLYGPGLSLVARLTNTLSTTFFNEFVAGYTNSHITLNDVAGTNVNIQRPVALDAPCGPNSSGGYQCPIGTIFNNGNSGLNGVAKLPGIVIGGNNAAYGGTGFSVDPSYMPWDHTNPTYSFADNLTKIVGRHNFQFGAQWIVFSAQSNEWADRGLHWRTLKGL